MSTSSALILIAGMAGVTYLTRLPLALLTVRRLRLPRLLDLVLEQIPVAAFAAIVFPAVLRADGHLDLHLSNLYLYALAATVAAAVALRGRVLEPTLAGVAVAIDPASGLRLGALRAERRGSAEPRPNGSDERVGREGTCPFRRRCKSQRPCASPDSFTAPGHARTQPQCPPFGAAPTGRPPPRGRSARRPGSP